MCTISATCHYYMDNTMKILGMVHGLINYYIIIYPLKPYLHSSFQHLDIYMAYTVFHLLGYHNILMHKRCSLGQPYYLGSSVIFRECLKYMFGI